MKTPNGTEYPDWLLYWTAGSTFCIALSFLVFMVTAFFFQDWAGPSSLVVAISLFSLVVCINIGYKYKPRKW